jgi:membrane protease subunit HflK
MSHEHEHEHEHEHVKPVQTPPSQQGGEPDAASRSLSDALRISFSILKVIMIVLIVGFVASGFRTVESGEKGLVLRFGRIHKTADPGWVWVLPYPIDELIRVPVGRKINLLVKSFWYKETREDILGKGVIPRNYVPDSLDPLQEGYCLTRSENYAPPSGPAANLGLASTEQSDESDYSIVHTWWEIDYQINSAEDFFKNVYVPQVNPGQVYFDVMTQSIMPLLRSVVDDAVVDAMVHYTIDEALQSTQGIPDTARRLMQQKLDGIDSGIYVTSARLVKAEWPKQVDEAFQESVTASQKSQGAIMEARTYAENTLNEAAGRVASQLYDALIDEKTTPEKREELWAQVAGQARDRTAQAQAYKTKVVENAKANADYLMKLLPEYRKRPELVAQGIYLSVIEQVLANADEKFIVQAAQSAKNNEIRVLVNRDQAKPKKQEQGQEKKQ